MTTTRTLDVQMVNDGGKALNDEDDGGALFGYGAVGVFRRQGL
jgi:hypothetical protein